MSEAGWGTDKPTKAGWYWWEHETTEACIACVYQDADGDWFANSTDWMNPWPLDDVDINARWLGPITPDAYAAGRKAGLTQYRDEIAQQLQLDHMHRQTYSKTDIIIALDKAERQIEAQAQGGSVRCQRCGGSGYTQSDDPARPLSRCGTCQGDGRYQPPQAKGGEHGKG